MLPAVPVSNLDADAGMRLLPGDGARRRSLLPVPAAMKRSGLPTPCSTAAAPRRLVKRPAAQAAPALTPPLTPPLGQPPKHTSTPLLSYSQVIEVSCLPAPPSDPKILKHQHSQSFDSAIGSSIASNNGDAAEATYASRKTTSAASHPSPTSSPQNIPRNDSPTIGHCTAMGRNGVLVCPAAVKQEDLDSSAFPIPPL